MMLKNDELRTLIDRRQFLQRAAMGGLALQITPMLPASSSQPGDVEIVSGILTAVADRSLTIQQDSTLRRVAINGSTSFWKGGDTSAHALKKGDDVMMRVLAPGDLALRVWSNLTRAKGIVVGRDGNDHVLRSTDHHTAHAKFLLRLSETASSAPRKLGDGDFIDAIGEKLSGGIRATLIANHLPDGTSLPQLPADLPAAQQTKVTRTMAGPVAMCNFQYSGYTNWYTCPNGANRGRCGTCDLAQSNQLAWPAFDTCGCCQFNCCDCSSGCKNQVYVSCGQQVNVTDLCQNRSLAMFVVDCGPCQQPNCGQCTPATCPGTCSDCLGFFTGIIDMPRQSFTSFYDPATRGCFSCNVSVTVPC